mgnify:CR=1 FL=1
MRRRGHKVGILDADVTGPSIPQVFGIHEKAGYRVPRPGFLEE